MSLPKNAGVGSSFPHLPSQRMSIVPVVMAAKYLSRQCDRPTRITNQQQLDQRIIRAARLGSGRHPGCWPLACNHKEASGRPGLRGDFRRGGGDGLLDNEF